MRIGESDDVTSGPGYKLARRRERILPLETAGRHARLRMSGYFLDGSEIRVA